MITESDLTQPSADESRRGRLLDLGRLPAKLIQQASRDPADSVSGAPANFGQSVLPHIYTIQAQYGTQGRAYLQADEALKHNRHNANIMRTETQIMECLEARQRGVALLNWHIEPEDDKSHDQRELVKELTRIVERTPDFLEYRRNLLEALWYGRYACANSFRSVQVGNHWRQVVGRWEPRHGDKLVFRYETDTKEYNPDQVGIRVHAGFYRDPLNHQKIEQTHFGLVRWFDEWERKLFSLHKHIIEDGPFEEPYDAGRIHGVGIRDRIYWTWYAMKELEANLLIYMERTALGVEIWRYPKGNPQAEEATRIAATERVANGRTIVLVPIEPGANAELYGVERIEPGGAGAEVMLELIRDFYGHRIKRYILGQVLSSEAASTGLGSGVADAHMATYADIIQYDATKLEESLTRDFLHVIRDRNFRHARGINVRFKIDTQADNVQEKLEALKLAWDMGLEMKTDDVFDSIGLSRPDKSDETVKNPQFDQAAMMGGMGGGMSGQGGGPSTFGPMPGNPLAGTPKDADSDGVAGEGTGQAKPATNDLDRYGRWYDPATVHERASQAKEDPSDPQREAGNYVKGHVSIHGLRLSIENPKGTRRRPEWPILPAHYGYIRGYEGRDKDHIDVFLGPDPNAEIVFIVDQVTEGGRFDEHKVMLGFHTQKEAVDTYRNAYQSGWRVGPVTSLTIDQFKRWLDKGDLTKRAEGQVSKYGAKWNEEDHPRGQPENAGQFTSGGGKGKGKGQSNRKKITESPEFKSWFGDSKVVDEDGNPLVVYHGTSADFDEFDSSRSKVDSGIYLTPDAEYASGYATSFASMSGRESPQGARVSPAYVAIRKPFFMLTKGPIKISFDDQMNATADQDGYGIFSESDIAKLKRAGYDGVIVGLTEYEYEKGYKAIDNAEEIVAFDPSQIKSATGNRGTFDPNDSRINYSANHIPGGIGDKTTPADVDPDELAAGIEVELEHTDDRAIAREIALDHLTEDPHYYAKLRTIESPQRYAESQGGLFGGDEFKQTRKKKTKGEEFDSKTGKQSTMWEGMHWDNPDQQELFGDDKTTDTGKLGKPEFTKTPKEKQAESKLSGKSADKPASKPAESKSERSEGTHPSKSGKWRWITIGGGEGGGGSHEGGTPVLIDEDGNIGGGPGALTGKNLKDLDKDKTGTSADKRKDNDPPGAGSESVSKPAEPVRDDATELDTPSTDTDSGPGNPIPTDKDPPGNVELRGSQFDVYNDSGKWFFRKAGRTDLGWTTASEHASDWLKGQFDEQAAPQPDAGKTESVADPEPESKSKTELFSDVYERHQKLLRTGTKEERNSLLDSIPRELRDEYSMYAAERSESEGREEFEKRYSEGIRREEQKALKQTAKPQSLPGIKPGSRTETIARELMNEGHLSESPDSSEAARWSGPGGITGKSAGDVVRAYIKQRGQKYRTASEQAAELESNIASLRRDYPGREVSDKLIKKLEELKAKAKKASE